MDDRTTTQIEEILAYATIARPPSLPLANMGQGMLGLPPVHAGVRALAGSADVGVTPRVKLHRDEY